MMKRVLPFLILVCSLFSITFYSCKKEEPDTEAQSAIDNSICEGEFTRIPAVVNEFGIRQNGIKSYQRGCPSIFVDPSDTLDGFPVTMVIDYGTAGCQDTDGKYRTGKVIVTVSNKWTNVGSSIAIKLQNYRVGTLNYGCDSILISRDAAHKFTTKIIGGKCWNASWNIEWSAIRTMEQTAGANDTISSNDEFQFTGNASGKNRKGKTYTANITLPIHKKTSCNWIDMGRLDLTPEGLATRTVDYGNGACDNDATLSINGNVYTFKVD